MVRRGCGKSCDGVGRLDIDVEEILRNHRAFHLHGKTDLARLVLSRTYGNLAVRAGLDAWGVQFRT
jgi:hypothetical protein